MNSLKWMGLITQMSAQFSIEEPMILAVIETESGGNEYAIRYEPHYRYLVEPRQYAANLGLSMATEEMLQRTSFGLMQPMGGVCREHSFDDNLIKIMDPKLSVFYGCKHLKKKMQRYGDDPATLYAAYNAGSPQKTAGGMFTNQRHVDHFYRNFLRVLDVLK